MGSVKCPSRIWLAALLATFLSTFSPVFAAWECEGRTCGTTLWFCCCASPEEARDANCGGEAPATGAAAACPSECQCVLTVRSADSSRSAPSAAVTSPDRHPAELPRPPALAGPLPGELTARSLERRGPPLPSACLVTPVLRGPPVLTPLTIGF